MTKPLANRDPEAYQRATARKRPTIVSASQTPTETHRASASQSAKETQFGVSEPIMRRDPFAAQRANGAQRPIETKASHGAQETHACVSEP